MEPFKNEFRVGQENAQIKSRSGAVAHVILILTAIVIASFSPVAVWAKLLIFFAVMLCLRDVRIVHKGAGLGVFWKRKSPEEKGVELGEALIAVVPEACRSMLTKLNEEGVRPGRRNARQFELEVFAYYMHVLDRLAFSILGVTGRKAFGDALTYSIANYFETDEQVSQLRDTYNKRQVQYANYKDVFPANGQPLKGTLVWEFSKILFAVTGGSNQGSLMSLSIMASDLTNTLYTSRETLKLLKS